MNFELKLDDFVGRTIKVRLDINGKGVDGQLSFEEKNCTVKIFMEDWQEIDFESISGQMVFGTYFVITKSIEVSKYHRFNDAQSLLELTANVGSIIISNSPLDLKSSQFEKVYFYPNDGDFLAGDNVFFGSLDDAGEKLELIGIDAPKENFNKIFYMSRSNDCIRIPVRDNNFYCSVNVKLRDATQEGFQVTTKACFGFEFGDFLSVDDSVFYINELEKILRFTSTRWQKKGESYLVVSGEGHAFERVCTHIDFWNMKECESPKETNRIHRPLVSVYGEKDAYRKLINYWFDTIEENSISRTQILLNIGSNKYSPDRLISSANSFDHLPKGLFAKDKLPSEVEEAKAVAEKAFKELSDPDYRNPILDALGRLGGVTLTKKVLTRLDLVVSYYGVLESDSIEIAKWCVRARNQYVHGGGYGFLSSTSFIVFMTNFLESVFVLSELASSGMGKTNWFELIDYQKHPVASFLKNYPEESKRFLDFIRLNQSK